MSINFTPHKGWEPLDQIQTAQRKLMICQKHTTDIRVEWCNMHPSVLFAVIQWAEETNSQRQS